jgi:ABC-type bacteriocin/lantibiotic exporter with double-glycine peptidase domain
LSLCALIPIMLLHAMSSKPPTVLKITLTTVFLLLLSCAASQRFDEQGSSNILQNIPFYQLKAHQCGPASLASVLNFWGISVSPADVADEIYSETARGTLSLDLIWYAERKGLKARQYKGSVDEIKRHVDMGHPLIVMVDYGFWVYEKNHFMVIVGYNEDGVIVNSGNGYPELLSLQDFLREWRRTGFWTLLITPKS